MLPFRYLSVALLGLWLVVGCACQKNDGSVTAAGTNLPLVTPAGEGHLDHAQPKLQTRKLWVGSQELNTELALSTVEIRTGMMFRTNMLENEAMLFVFAYPHQTSFYMKNTLIPLSCAYIDPDGTILEIHDMVPKNEDPIEATATNIQYVLETPKGWFEKNNIKTGTLIRLEAGTLPEVFFPKGKRR